MRLLAAAMAVAILWATGSLGAEVSARTWKAHYPEGPLWEAGVLYYAEMFLDRIMRIEGETATVLWQQPGCGPTSIAPYGAGELVILCHRAGRLVRIDRQGLERGRIESDGAGAGFLDPNDSIADGRGGIYFTISGIFAVDAPSEGTVHHLSPEGIVTRLAAGLRYANGVILDGKRKRLLVSEHLARRVLSFPVHEDGRLGLASPFAVLDALAPPVEDASPLAGPDGLELDEQGNLYICEYGAGRVLVVGPDGRLRTIIPWSQPFITNIALAFPGRKAFLTGSSTNLRPPFPGLVEEIGIPLR